MEVDEELKWTPWKHDQEDLVEALKLCPALRPHCSTTEKEEDSGTLAELESRLINAKVS